MKGAVASLRKIGLSLPDDTDAENLVETIVAAVTALAGAKQREPDQESEGGRPVGFAMSGRFYSQEEAAPDNTIWDAVADAVVERRFARSGAR